VYDQHRNEIWLAGMPIVVAGMPYEAHKEYYLVYTDSWGNVSDTSNHFTIDFTPQPPDEISPTLNGDPTTSNITQSSITVSWPAASDNVAVTGYKVNWRATGGSWLETTTTNTTVTFNNLSASTAYEFYYTARDAAGNVSDNSSTVSATTLAVTPPPPPATTVVLEGVANGQQHSLAWTTNATIQTQFLYRKDKPNGAWEVIHTGASPFSYIQKSNKKFYYQVVINGQYYSNIVPLQSRR
jgi:chitodextrinase